jgi:class 3 adenylate cyclase
MGRRTHRTVVSLTPGHGDEQGRPPEAGGRPPLGSYETYEPRGVPEPGDIALGKKAAKLEATVLFVDVRQSSAITTTFRRQTAAKMLKSYFDGSVRIINGEGGAVRSFNGDGMLALFVGDNRSNDAAMAAFQLKWFVADVLRPKFNRLFDGNEKARGKRLAFDIGCALDDGDIYAVRVGIRGTNDVAWVGRCTNTAAKLSNVLTSPDNIGVTRAVYARLNGRRVEKNGEHKWSGEKWGTFGGVKRAYRTTTWWWSL